MSQMIALNNVSVDIDQSFSLKNLTFEVGEGEIFGFLGANGSGKTTVIRLLTKKLNRRLKAKKSGDIYFKGNEIEQTDRSMYDELGILFDTNHLYDRLTIEENIQFFASLRGKGKKEVHTLLTQVGLFEHRRLPYKKCSREMKQRAALAAALVHKPKLLFLDEPTAGLDLAAKREIHKLLISLKGEGTTIFITTHSMNEAERICQRIAILYKGQLVECGDPKELKVKYAKHKVYINTPEGLLIREVISERGARLIQEIKRAERCLTIHSDRPEVKSISYGLAGRELL